MLYFLYIFWLIKKLGDEFVLVDGNVLLVESLFDELIQLYLEAETGPQVCFHILVQMCVMRHIVYGELFGFI